MRRLMPFALAALFTILSAMPAMAGGRPEKINLGPETFGPETFAGTCDFDVQLVDSFASARLFVFPEDRHGNGREAVSGGYKSTLTNLSHPDQPSIDISYFGRVEYVFRPDGTVRATSSGGALYWLTDADAAMYGLEPGIYLIHGRVVAELDQDFLATEPATVQGSITPLCPMLAG